MKCKNCGTELMAGFKCCPECGTKVELGTINTTITENSTDDELRQAVANGNTQAMCILADNIFAKGIEIDNVTDVENPKYIEAFELVRKAAELGDPEGQYETGLYYSAGFGVEKSDIEAFNWYKKAFAQGHQLAVAEVGHYYLYGAEGVEEDEDEAFKILYSIKDSEISIALYDLACCYKNGIGTEEDEDEAIFYLDKAANLGNETASFIYGKEKYLAEEYEDAFNFLSYAAENGIQDAHFWLGLCYENGEGVEQDYEEAAKHYRVGAEANDSDAQWKLGLLIISERINGKRKEAYKLIKDSMEQENPTGTYFYALCRRDGIGVEANLEKAIEYLEKAVELGVDSAEEDLIEAREELNGGSNTNTFAKFAGGTVAGAAIGGVLLGPLGAIIGGTIGNVISRKK